MHIRFGLLDLVGDPRQPRRIVDQNLEPIPRPRRRLAGGKAPGRRVESAKPADPREPPAVMRNDEPLDRLAHRIVQS
jgi:hypothetical protein